MKDELDYEIEWQKLEREIAACSSIEHAANVECSMLSFLRNEARRSRCAAFYAFERTVRARIAELRLEWPTGYEITDLGEEQ